MDDDFFLHLTDVGREVAEQTYEKHCFFTRLLIDAGVDPEMAEQDACRMEHTISENEEHMANAEKILTDEQRTAVQQLQRALSLLPIENPRQQKFLKFPSSLG